MTDFTEYRHHPDGSIDYGFYRAKAAALRRQAMREPLTRRLAVRFGLAQTAMLAAAVFAAGILAFQVPDSAGRAGASTHVAVVQTAGDSQQP